jgi:hypothetical protein
MGEMAMERYLANCAFGNILYFETRNGYSGMGILCRV